MDSPNVTAALSRAVRDHGRRATTQPERIRALLSDLLGPSARELRAEVDALVVACEEGVPGLLLSSEGLPDAAADEAVARLEARGLQPGLAFVAVTTWATALAVPLSETRSLSDGSVGEVSSRSGGVLSSSDGGEAPRGDRTELPEGRVAGHRRSAVGSGVDPARAPALAPADPDEAIGPPPRRRPSPRARTVVGAAGAAAVLVAGLVGAQAFWPPSEGGPADGSPGGTLHLLSTAPVTWDPMATTDVGLRLLMNRALYRSLLAFAPTDADQPAELVPDLATSTGTSTDGGRTWAWTLVDDARWEDGQPVTCADAKAGVERAFGAAKFKGYSFKAARLVDVPLAPDGLPVFSGATDPTARASFDDAVTCAGRTLTVRLNGKHLDFARYLALPELAPYRSVASAGGPRSLANGPYRVEVASAEGDSSVLVRNARWSRTTDHLRPAYPDRIEVTGRLGGDDVVARLQADAGADRRAAALQPLPASAEAGLRRVPARTHVATNGNREVLAPSFDSAAMKDKQVRQALSWSVDRQAYVESMGGPATRTALHSLAGAHRNSADELVDPGRARTLLAGRHPVLRVAYHSTGEADAAMSGLAAGWESVGFTVQLKPFTGTSREYSRHLSETNGDKVYDLVRANPTVGLDPVENVSEYDSRVTTRWLAKGYSNTAITSAIDRARTTLDPADRVVAWNLVHSLATADAAVIPLAARVSLVGHGSAVEGARTLGEFSGALDTVTMSLTHKDQP